VKILVDVNLSPRWRERLALAGHEATHWSEIGSLSASDALVMNWAREHGHVVLTHDLDFTALLAASRAAGPSVVQVRAQDVLPEVLAPLVLRALAEFEPALQRGAILTLEPGRARIRLLPLTPTD
jgi:predicted nuclease of predicted toxin-antitoxin system